MLELTMLNKSYKMVVLRVLLDRGALWDGMEIRPLAGACREYLIGHRDLQSDLRPNRDIPDHDLASAEDWANWWLKWPLGRSFDEQEGRKWFRREGERFVSAIQCPKETRVVFES